MLANINGALRGVYVVESIDLEFVEEAKIAIAAAGLRPEPRPKADAGGEPPPRSHRLSLDLRWPQQLRCRVRGYRPAGGGLPPFLRSAAKQLAGRDKKRRDVGFCLKARLAGAPRVGLLFASSRTSPWPRTTRVELERPPKIELDRDALSIVDDAADSEHSLRFLKLLYGFVPKEVLVGMLERKRDPVDALRAAVASAAKNAQPSLASIRKKAETLGRDLPKQRRRLFEAAREIAAAAAVSSSPKALPMPRVGFKGDDEEEDDDDDDDDDELDLDDEDDEEELDEEELDADARDDVLAEMIVDGAPPPDDDDERPPPGEGAREDR
ncbi:hypothetical protein SO694_00012165 [Aureococcus anophagefferens]|uniref:Uncharacterized protein n=1 Tax=Aureococcus anophagefferens TaxID=44056 RepID=A0ABR1G1D7_AURAN